MRKILSLICFISLTFFLYSQDTSFKEKRSEHFIIYYKKEVSEFYVLRLIERLENFYRQLTQEFNFIRENLWLWENRAKVYVVKDVDEYIKSFNCPSWSVACVNYTEKIIYTYQDEQKFVPICVHELTHIIFREYVGRGNLPAWLDEAIAMYMENKFTGSRSYINKFLVKNIIESGKYIKFKDLVNIDHRDFDAEKATVFYAQSFSIVDFLIRKYGKDNFTQLLFYLRSGLSFEEAFKKAYLSFNSFLEVEEAWKKYFKEN